jgi:RIO kinase 2
MSLIKGSILNKVPSLENPGKVFARIMDIMIRLARCGLVHCDFNEFNMFLDDDDRVTIIDFPQMVSVDHPNAAVLFDRDTNCLRVFFERRFSFIASAVPSISSDCADRLESLDNAVKASGFDNEHQRRLEQGLAILGVDMAKKREKEARGEARLLQFSPTICQSRNAFARGDTAPTATMTALTPLLKSCLLLMKRPRGVLRIALRMT